MEMSEDVHISVGQEVRKLWSKQQQQQQQQPFSRYFQDNHFQDIFINTCCLPFFAFKLKHSSSHCIEMITD